MKDEDIPYEFRKGPVAVVKHGCLSGHCFEEGDLILVSEYRSERFQNCFGMWGDRFGVTQSLYASEFEIIDVS